MAQLVKKCLQPPGPQLSSRVGKICLRRERLPTPVFLGFPCGSAGKESTRNAGDLGSIPGLGRSPGEGSIYPHQHSGLENSMHCIVHGVTKIRTRLSDSHFTSHTKHSPAPLPSNKEDIQRGQGLQGGVKDPREERGTPGRSWGPQGGVGTPGRGRGSQGGAGDPREGPGTQGGAGDPREGLGTPGRSGEPQGETGHLATADPPGGFGREDKQRLQGDPSQEPGQPRWVGARLQVAVFDLTHPQPPEEQVETRVLLARSSRSHQPCPPCLRGLEPRGERAAPSGSVVRLDSHSAPLHSLAPYQEAPLSPEATSPWKAESLQPTEP